MVGVKVCGVTSVADAIGSIEAGADVIGLNFWPGTARRCDVTAARRIVEALPAHAQVVAVFVDAELSHVRQVLDTTGIAWAQLHGHETPAYLEALLPNAYKALGAADRSVIETAQRYGGEHLLLDAVVPGLVGGTGRTFDWDLAAEVAEERQLTLAGGLTPSNVAEAIRRVRPHRVDVASGVELRPGVKDVAKVRAFVEAARSAG